LAAGSRGRYRQQFQVSDTSDVLALPIIYDFLLLE